MEESKKIEDFKKWLIENGANSSRLDFKEFEEGRGPVATEEILAGQELCSLPIKMLISMKTAERSEIGKIIKERGISLLQQNEEVEWGVLYLFVLYEKRKGKDSFWYPYFSYLLYFFYFFKKQHRILPSIEEINTPLSFNQLELDALRGTNLYDAIIQIKKKLQNIHNILFVDHKVQEIFPILFSEHEEYYSVEKFTWIYQIFWSRALSVIIEGEQIGALVPLCDMTNHSSSVKVDYFSDVVSERFALITRDGVSKGMQIYNNYGIRSNEKLLLNYGFMFFNNPADSFYFKISFSNNTVSNNNNTSTSVSDNKSAVSDLDESESAFQSIKKSILSFLQKKKSKLNTITDSSDSSDSSISNSKVVQSIGIDHFLMRNYKLEMIKSGDSVDSVDFKEEIDQSKLVIDSQTIESFGFCILDQSDFYFYNFSSITSNKKILSQIYLNLYSLLTSKLKSICQATSTSIAEDLQIISKKSTMTRNMKMCIEYRLDQKLILKNAINQIVDLYLQLSSSFSSELSSISNPTTLGIENNESKIYLQAFDKWLDANSISKNFQFHEISSKVTWSTTKELVVGESLISLPYQFLITVEYFFTTNLGKLIQNLQNKQAANMKIVDWCKSLGLNENILLALAIMEEEHCNSESIWKLFFQAISTSLIHSPILMCFHNQDILDDLSGCNVQDAIVDILEEFREEWKVVVSLISSSVTTEMASFFTPENYVRSRVIVEKYQRKVTTIKSNNKSFNKLELIVEDNSPEFSTVVVPLAFLPRGKITIRTIETEKTRIVNVVTGIPYQTNKIIYDSFDHLDSKLLFVYFGLIPTSEESTYEITMEVDPQDPLLKMRVLAMEYLGLFNDSKSEGHSFVHFLKENTFPSKLLDAFKITFMTKKELKSFLSGLEKATEIDWNSVINYISSANPSLIVGKKTEQKAKRELKNMILSLLDQFSEGTNKTEIFCEYKNSQKKIIESLVKLI